MQWFAFASFAVGVITVSSLSSSLIAQKRATNEKEQELSRLHEFGKALLEVEGSELSALAQAVLDSFNFEYCSICLRDPKRRWRRASVVRANCNPQHFPPSGAVPMTIDTLLEEYENGVRYVVMKKNETLIGILCVKSDAISFQSLEAIGDMIALILGHKASRLATGAYATN